MDIKTIPEANYLDGIQINELNKGFDNGSSEEVTEFKFIVEENTELSLLWEKINLILQKIENLKLSSGSGGFTGADGKSAYDLARLNGFKGTIEDWLLSLIGATGKDGKDGKDGKAFTFDMFTTEELELLRGPQGPQGPQGPAGKDAEILIVDALNSTLTNKALSANQGRVLKSSIDNITTILNSNDTNLDTLQEIVNFIKINKETLNALTIGSISGLADMLASKLDKNQNAVSASKLATPVKINNKLFDGSANINLEEDAMVVKEKVVNLTGDVIQTSLGSVFIKTITEDTTLSLITSYNTGETNSFILELTNGGNYIINWWSDVKWNGGQSPTLTNNGKDILGFYSYGTPRVTIGVVLSKDAKIINEQSPSL